MEQRRNDRIVIGYEAEILYRGGRYECAIDNLSAGGANVIAVSTSDVVFSPNELLELRFTAHTGETVDLKCSIRWVKDIMPGRSRIRIGLQFVDSSLDQYACFI